MANPYVLFRLICEVDEMEASVAAPNRARYNTVMGLGFPEVENFSQPRNALARANRRRAIGRWLCQFVEAYTGVRDVDEAHIVWLARTPSDRMSDDEIDNYMRDFIYSASTEPDEAANVVRTIQGQIIGLVAPVLKDDPAVRSVLNVGVYHGIVDHYLAKQFPTVSFTGVDFWQNLIEINAPLALPNLSIVRGYALDLLERGEIRGDLVFFSSTATRMKNLELRRYLRALAKSTRYVVFNEPIFRRPDGWIAVPSQLPLDYSCPVHKRHVFAGDRNGPLPPCLVHNYEAMCREAGFEPIYCRTIKQEPDARIWLVAKLQSVASAIESD